MDRLPERSSSDIAHLDRSIGSANQRYYIESNEHSGIKSRHINDLHSRRFYQRPAPGDRGHKGRGDEE